MKFDSKPTDKFNDTIAQLYNRRDYWRFNRYNKNYSTFSSCGLNLIVDKLLSSDEYLGVIPLMFREYTTFDQLWDDITHLVKLGDRVDQIRHSILKRYNDGLVNAKFIDRSYRNQPIEYFGVDLYKASNGHIIAHVAEPFEFDHLAEIIDDFKDQYNNDHEL